jgi:PAS domain S-box-containing protein
MIVENSKIELTSSEELRRIAEERMGARNPEMSLPRTEEAMLKIWHELEVHQIELVLQNEELRQARYEMETILEKYTDLYESAPVGYLTLDRNGIITAMNLTFANMLRIERLLLIGRSFVEFLTEECLSLFTTFLNSVFSDQSNKSCEMVLLNNVSVPVIVQIGAATTASGMECRFVMIDITEQRKREEKTSSSNIPDISMVEPARMELELTVFSLRDALDASLMMLRELAFKGGIELHLNLETEVDERIVADQEKLKQIMFNLLSNAIKFSAAGGTVNVSAVKDADFIRITVADSGIGLSEQNILNLFETFNQIESLYTGESDTAGLGLTLTRQLVELHGGTVSVESKLGIGSSFSFTIPLRNCTGIT